MRALNLAASVLFLTAACSERPPLNGPSGLPRPLLTISDAVHSGGNPRFYFLPPLVPQPTTQGAFDALLSPRVQICIDYGYCEIIAQFSTSSGTGGATVDVDAAAKQYQVNWDTRTCDWGPCSLDPALNYRIEVLANDLLLGYADVKVVANGSELKNVQTGEHIGLVDGRTLPLRFRVETGLVGSVLVTPNPVTVGIGLTAALAVTVTDLHGNVLEDPVVDWASASPAVGTVSASGVVAGMGSGCTRVTATSGGIQGSTEVMVTSVPGLGPTITAIDRSPVGTAHLDTVAANQFPRGGHYAAVVRGSGFCFVQSIAFSNSAVTGSVVSISEASIGLVLASSRVAEGDTTHAPIDDVSFTLTEANGAAIGSGPVGLDIVKGPPPRISLAVINGVTAVTVNQTTTVEYAAEVWSAGNTFFEFLAGPTTQALTFGPQAGDRFHWTRSRISLAYTPSCICGGDFTIGYGVVDGAGRSTRQAVTLPVVAASP